MEEGAFVCVKPQEVGQCDIGRGEVGVRIVVAVANHREGLRLPAHHAASDAFRWVDAIEMLGGGHLDVAVATKGCALAGRQQSSQERESPALRGRGAMPEAAKSCGFVAHQEAKRRELAGIDDCPRNVRLCDVPVDHARDKLNERVVSHPPAMGGMATWRLRAPRRFGEGAGAFWMVSFPGTPVASKNA